LLIVFTISFVILSTKNYQLAGVQITFPIIIVDYFNYYRYSIIISTASTFSVTNQIVSNEIGDDTYALCLKLIKV